MSEDASGVLAHVEKRSENEPQGRVVRGSCWQIGGIGEANGVN